MAERFGGRYSPGAPEQGDTPPANNPYRSKHPARAGGRVNFLFLAPFALLIRAFTSDPVGLATGLGAFGLLILAAWMTREGLKAQDAYDARRVARRPALPRKMFGSALTGAGLFVAGVAPGANLIAPLIFAVLGAGLHFLAFGPDPLRDKGMEGIDTFQQDRVARVVKEAEQHLAAMSDAIKAAGDRKLELRVEQFQTTVRDMFRTIEQDPRDLTAARRYLVVYLLGARDATIKFADIYGRTHDADARADYAALLRDLDGNFAARTRDLMLDNKSDLDVEIEVLRERLQREGVRPEATPSESGEV